MKKKAIQLTGPALNLAVAFDAEMRTNTARMAAEVEALEKRIGTEADAHLEALRMKMLQLRCCSSPAWTWTQTTTCLTSIATRAAAPSSSGPGATVMKTRSRTSRRTVRHDDRQALRQGERQRALRGEADPLPSLRQRRNPQ